MNCYLHEQKSAIGTCVGCGKFICEECKTEIKGKYYCKKCVDELFDEKSRKIENLENKSNLAQTPTVFMNAGGGGGGSSSSSASSSASSSGGRFGTPPYPVNSVMIHILLFLFTAGIGNVIYFLYIRGKQKQWTQMYR